MLRINNIFTLYLFFMSASGGNLRVHKIARLRDILFSNFLCLCADFVFLCTKNVRNLITKSMEKVSCRYLENLG